MRALVACLALFLALAVLHCDAKRRKRDAADKEGNCEYSGYVIKDGNTKRLSEPCEKVSCSGGSVNVTTCSMRQRSEGRSKDKEVKEEKQRDGQKDKDANAFPHCCSSKTLQE
uniref:Secreted protein n=1 Tax=Amblyomma cajennense TaxID=34607 RepID=A0A023FFA3_AMBCJ